MVVKLCFLAVHVDSAVSVIIPVNSDFAGWLVSCGD